MFYIFLFKRKNSSLNFLFRKKKLDERSDKARTFYFLRVWEQIIIIIRILHKCLVKFFHLIQRYSMLNKINNVWRQSARIKYFTTYWTYKEHILFYWVFHTSQSPLPLLSSRCNRNPVLPNLTRWKKWENVYKLL